MDGGVEMTLELELLEEDVPMNKELNIEYQDCRECPYDYICRHTYNEDFKLLTGSYLQGSGVIGLHCGAKYYSFFELVHTIIHEALHYILDVMFPGEWHIDIIDTCMWRDIEKWLGLSLERKRRYPPVVINNWENYVRTALFGLYLTDARLWFK